MRGGVGPAAHLHADEHVRLLAVGDAVVELGDARGRPTQSHRTAGSCPRSSGIVTANTASRASPTSARSATNRSRSKFMFAPQVIATSVASRGARRAAAYSFSPATPSAPGRLEDAAGVLEHVLDGGAAPRRCRPDELVDQLPAQPERLLAHLLARRCRRRTGRRRPASPGVPPASERAIASESSSARRSTRDLGPQRLHVGGDAGDQPAAADRRRRSRRGGPWRWRRISMPTVPWPAITSGSSNGWTKVSPRSAAISVGARRRRRSRSRRASTTSTRRRRSRAPRRPSPAAW